MYCTREIIKYSVAATICIVFAVSGQQMHVAKAAAEHVVPEATRVADEPNELNKPRDYKAVGLLQFTCPTGVSPPWTCTGTAIAKDLVLTAAHCLSEPKCKVRNGESPTIQFTQGIYSHGQRLVHDRSVELQSYNFRGVPQVSLSNQLDYAVLKVKPQAGRALQELQAIGHFEVGRDSPAKDNPIRLLHIPGEQDPLLMSVCPYKEVNGVGEEFLIYRCWSYEGSSGGLLFGQQLQDGVLRYPVWAIHKGDMHGRQSSDPGSLKRGTSVAALLDSVTKKIGVIGPGNRNASVFDALTRWWQQPHALSYKAPLSCELDRSCGVTRQVSSVGSGFVKVAYGAAVVDEETDPEVESSRLGYSPPSNMRFALSPSGSSSPLSLSGHQVDFIDYEIPGSDPDIILKLVSAMPAEFRPADRYERRTWNFETVALSRNTVGANNHAQLSELSKESVGTLWEFPLARLASGVEVHREFSHKLEFNPRGGNCLSYSGKIVEIPTFYQELEEDYRQTNVYNDVDESRCLVGLLRRTPIETRDVLEFNPRKPAGASSTIGFASQRYVLQDLSIGGAGGLIPPVCDNTKTSCVSTVSFDKLDEVTIDPETDELGAERYEKIVPVFRRKVFDVLRTLNRTSDHAVVQVIRCQFLGGENDKWPTSQDVVSGRCPGKYHRMRNFLVEYSKGHGLTCRLDFAPPSQERTAFVRTWRDGAGNADCLSQFVNAATVWGLEHSIEARQAGRRSKFAQR